MDLVSIISLSILLVWFVGSLILSLKRGLVNARIRGIFLLASAAGAVGATILLRDWVVSSEFTHDYIIPWLQRMDQSVIIELLGLSDTVREIVVKSAASLVAPLLCFLLFVILSFLTWIVYLMVTLPGKSGDSPRALKKRTLAPLRAVVWGLLTWVIAFAFLMLPIATYAELLAPVDKTLEQSDLLKDAEAKEIYGTVSDTLESLNSGVVKAYQSVGGKWFCGLIADFEVGEEKVHMPDEIDAMAGFTLDILDLVEVKVEDYGDREEALFASMADRFAGSKLLPMLVGDVVENATDHWLDGEEFMGMKKPEFGEAEDIFGPFFTQLLTVLNQDSQNKNALVADLRTIGDLVSIFAENGVFENLSNEDGLTDVLTKDGLTDQIVKKLNESATMYVLVDEITDMGLRVVANKVVAPDVDPEEYEPMMEDVAGALNDIKTMPEEERREHMNNELNKALADAGIEDVDSTLVDLYAGRLEEELLVKDNITADDVREFFNKYYPGNQTSSEAPAA